METSGAPSTATSTPHPAVTSREGLEGQVGAAHVTGGCVSALHKLALLSLGPEPTDLQVTKQGYILAAKTCF